jgi:hypothetical protein
MEDKWDIFSCNGSLYFSRSWTGEFIIKVDTNRVENGLKFAHIQYAKPAFYDNEHCLWVVEYLFKSHCFDMIVPHPLPKTLSNDPVDIVLYSFANFGRRGWFATFNCTLGIYNKDRYGFPPHDTGIRP